METHIAYPTMPIKIKSSSLVLRLLGFVQFAAVLSFSVLAHAQERLESSTVPSADTRITCSDQLASQNYAAAAKAANLALTRITASADPAGRFDILVCRAAANVQLGNNLSSERDYREALRVAAKSLDPFDVRLIDPLTELGRLRLSDGDPDQAELFLLRARDITHRNSGIYNVEQDAVLADLAKVFVLQGRRQQAGKQQVLRLRSAREAYGDSPELVEALHNYAVWNAEVENFSKVRIALEEAVSVLEKHYGVNAPQLIDTLKLRSELYRQHPSIVTPKAGAEAMQRVVDIYEAQEYVDQVDLLEARKALGDWYIMGMGRTHRKGISYYKKSVKQAISDGVDEALIDDFFGQPELIFLDTSRKTFFVGEDAGAGLKSGILRVRYNVDRNGKPRKIQFIEDTVNIPLVKSAIFGRVNTARFRPRFVDGKAVKTVTVEQTFEVNPIPNGLELGKMFAPEIPAR